MMTVGTVMHVHVYGVEQWTGRGTLGYEIQVAAESVEVRKGRGAGG